MVIVANVTQIALGGFKMFVTDIEFDEEDWDLLNNDEELCEEFLNQIHNISDEDDD